jgi:hypothetical protein
LLSMYRRLMETNRQLFRGKKAGEVWKGGILSSASFSSLVPILYYWS